MTTLTLLFSIYIVLAVGYNIMSVVLNEVTGRSAAPTEPMIGFVTITVLYLTFAIGPLISNFLYLFLLTAFMLFILRFGVLRHVFGFDKSAYYSRSTWAAAILINIFGVITLGLIIIFPLFESIQARQ